MSVDAAKLVIEAATAAIWDAYIEACDQAKAAIDPNEVTDNGSIISLLDEAYEIMIRREDLVASGAVVDWSDAAQLTG